MILQKTDAAFQTTRWSLIRDLHEASEHERRAAMEELTRSCWPPVYAYLRRAGRTPDDAADLTQGFFSDVVLGRGLFDAADRGKGRLRSLILCALKRYMIDDHRRAKARRSAAMISIDARDREERLLSPAIGARTTSAEEAFDNRWAQQVLQEAIARCRGYCFERGLSRNWEAFEARVLRPAVGASDPPPLKDLAGRLGFADAGNAAAAVQHIKRRTLTFLREVVARTVTAPEDVDEEMRAITRLLG